MVPTNALAPAAPWTVFSALQTYLSGTLSEQVSTPTLDLRNDLVTTTCHKAGAFTHWPFSPLVSLLTHLLQARATVFPRGDLDLWSPQYAHQRIMRSHSLAKTLPLLPRSAVRHTEASDPGLQSGEMQGSV